MVDPSSKTTNVTVVEGRYFIYPRTNRCPCAPMTSQYGVDHFISVMSVRMLLSSCHWWKVCLSPYRIRHTLLDCNLTHNDPQPNPQLLTMLSRDLELAFVNQGLYAVRTIFYEQMHEKSLSSHQGIVLPSLPPHLWLPHSHNPCYQLVIPSYGTIVNLPLDVIQIVDNFDSEYH